MKTTAVSDADAYTAGCSVACVSTSGSASSEHGGVQCCKCCIFLYIHHAALHDALCLLAVTPPGYKTTDGQTTVCAAGEYRVNWVSYRRAEATKCDVCGDNISSEDTDTITVYDSTTGDASLEVVKGSRGACCK